MQKPNVVLGILKLASAYSVTMTVEQGKDVIGLRMITIRKSRVHFTLATLLLISLFIGITGYEYWDEYDLAAIPNQTAQAPTGNISITVKIPARIL